MIIRNGNFNRLAGFWSFHTILVFYEGQLDRLSNILQKDAKFATLTIGNLRKNPIAEYTKQTHSYEDKWFFYDNDPEFIQEKNRCFTILSVKPE